MKGKKWKYFGLTVLFLFLSLMVWIAIGFTQRDIIAKPVIYLYPEKTAEISVKVTPIFGISESIPDYANGWEVVSDKDSNILNKRDNKIYPYLFWESDGMLSLSKDFDTPKEGFVVAKEDLEKELRDKLFKLGLNEKEIFDFNDFWVEKLSSQNKPYYFITFYSLDSINRTAPLEIFPEPDSVIRVLMVAKGLNKFMDVPELQIETPIRSGFSVVEWGGILK